MQEQRRISLQTKLAISFAILAIITSAVTVFSLYAFARSQARQSIRQRLLDIVSVAVLQVDAEQHSALVNIDQMESQEYQDSKLGLQAIRDSSDTLEEVYTMRFQDDNVIFIVDADEETSADLTEVYEETDPFLYSQMSSISTEPWVDKEFTSDRWGDWLSAFAPIITSNGRVDGVLGVDMPVSDVLDYEERFLWIALAIFMITTPLVAGAGWLIGKRLTNPLIALKSDVAQIASGDLEHRAQVTTNDEIAELATAFNAMTTRVTSLVTQLEGQISTRTQQLEIRTEYLEASNQLSQSIATILDPDQLIGEVVKQIRNRFNLYYAGLFLTDPGKEWAILKAGTGSAGQAMIARGHRIRVGSGMIGWSVANAQPRIAQEAEDDAVRLVTPELPETRSEAALPLRSRGEVLGAITVQSEKPDAFDQQTIAVLQSAADQVAIALDNARLFTESQAALEAERRAFSLVGREAWQEIQGSRSNWGYHFENGQIHPVQDDWSLDMVEAARTGSTVDNDQGNLAIPIKVRDNVIGVLRFQKNDLSESTEPWTQEEITTLEAILTQVGQAMESARLYQETRRRAERERLTGEITAKLRSSTNPQTIMKTAVHELRSALQAKRAQVLLHPNHPANSSTGSSDEPPMETPDVGGPSVET